MKSLSILLVSCSILVAYNASSQTWELYAQKSEEASLSNKLDSAVVFGGLALSLAESQNNVPDSAISFLLHRQGVYYQQVGSFMSADSLLRRALAFRERTLQAMHPDIAATLSELGFVNIRLGLAQQAESLLTSALRIQEASLGPASRNVAGTLGYLGLASFYLGHGSECESRNQRALAILDQLGTPVSAEAGLALDNLALLYWVNGQLTRADETGTRALKVREQALGLQANDVAETLNKLGLIHTDQRKFARAEAELKRAIQIQQTLFGSDYFRLANPINNLARLYAEMGRFEEAIGPYAHARRLAIRRLGEKSVTALLTASNLAGMYTATRRYHDAEDLLQHTFADESDAPDSTILFNLLTGMADLRTTQGRFSEADSLYQRVLRMASLHSNPDHANTSNTLLLYSQMLSAKGDFSKAWSTALRSFRIRSRNFFEDSFVLSERDRLNYTSLLSNATTDALSAFCMMNIRDDRVNIECAEVIFSAKGTNTEVVASPGYHFSPAAGNIHNEYRLAKDKLARTFVQFGPGTKVQNVMRNRDSLQARIDQLEADLGRASLEFRMQKQKAQIHPDSLAGYLPHNATLIEYFRFTCDQRLKPDTVTSSPGYLAVVLKDNGELHIVDLGGAGKIDETVQRMRSMVNGIASRKTALTPENQMEYDVLAKAISHLVFDPVQPYVGMNNTLFIAPDGALNMVPFGGLVGNDGRYLIEQYPIHYVSAGRDLMRIHHDTTASGIGLVAFGDPDYDASVGARSSNDASLTYVSPQGEVSRERNVRSNCESLSEIKVGRLMNTRNEVDNIAAIWRGKTAPVQIYLGSSASEENFKLNASEKKVIHLATHGYFIAGHCEEETGKTSALFPGENPLLESGLLLSGANLHGSDIRNDEAEDGILTALEVSAMDLHGADLVVLSACETGLGRVEQGEGVYGLRRAFQLAGARTVVSSLWQVPDDETMRFMRILYSAKAKTYPDLMQQVALKRIKESRLRGRPVSPFTWGAFIATGDWRIR